MKENQYLVKQLQDSLGSDEKLGNTYSFQKDSENIVNRFIEDLRGKPTSGSRIGVQLDWATGRIAISSW